MKLTTRIPTHCSLVSNAKSVWRAEEYFPTQNSSGNRNEGPKVTTKSDAGYDRKAAAALLKSAKAVAKRGASWLEANNTLFGIGTDFSRQFPTVESRQAFHAGPEYAEIRQLLSGLQLPHESTRDPGGPSGKFLVRLPKSVHAALQAEAESEGVSLNQLALTKLSIGLRDAIVRR